jgi:transcriptional regulator with XRE-family HTH domain
MCTPFHKLNQRRKDLGMSYQALARRSGVSMPTVVRILMGRNPQASFGNVSAIAQALGMTVSIEPTHSPQDVRERQAQTKARKLVGIVQGTSGLEAQAVDPDRLESMTRQTVHELLAGSPRRLWG